MNYKYGLSQNDVKTIYLKCGTKVNAINNSFINHPIIRDRINHIIENGLPYSLDKRTGITKRQRIKVSENKYFHEAPLVQYASGICVKKYNENK